MDYSFILSLGRKGQGAVSILGVIGGISALGIIAESSSGFVPTLKENQVRMVRKIKHENAIKEAFALLNHSQTCSSAFAVTYGDLHQEDYSREVYYGLNSRDIPEIEGKNVVIRKPEPIGSSPRSNAPFLSSHAHAKYYFESVKVQEVGTTRWLFQAPSIALTELKVRAVRRTDSFRKVDQEMTLFIENDFSQGGDFFRCYGKQSREYVCLSLGGYLDPSTQSCEGIGLNHFSAKALCNIIIGYDWHEPSNKCILFRGGV